MARNKKKGKRNKQEPKKFLNLSSLAGRVHDLADKADEHLQYYKDEESMDDIAVAQEALLEIMRICQ